ncbi:MAG: M23 family metallopeptidase [Verrucomicrobiae bacterium]|nr:M23 family metallopeptidase [Verrucomicrobiae bacterium]
MRQFSFRRLISVLAVGLSVTAVAIDGVSAKTASQYIADGFDYPVGKPDASGYYKARGYYPNGHLGEDWNGKGGGNTDQGDPIYAIGHGVVVYSDDFKAGWGNVVIIRHAYREKNGQIAYIDSLYGHLNARLVREGARVARGEKIGTMGRGPHNMYYAHLHFEIRKNLAVGMYRSDYKRDYSVYHSPTHFIEKYRRLRPEYRRVSIPVDTFRQSNPNLLTMEKVAAPAVAKGVAGQPAESRPDVPAVVEEVIRTQTDAQPSNTEEKRGIWNRMMGFLGQRRTVKD